MTKVKLCGLYREEDILVANELKPDYIGFVLNFEKSHRNLTYGKARWLKSLLNPDIMVVGVFVNTPVEEIAELVNDGVIDVVQLHGSEDNKYIEKLRKMCTATIIKAMRFSDENLYANAENTLADYVLLDSGKGEGKSYDFTVAKGISKPLFLAGGLSLSNVENAVKELKPFAVDVSSGIETDKIKDPAKMKEFVNKVRCSG